MNRLVFLFLALILTLSLCACGQKVETEAPTDEPTWQEQYDLGIRYLSEGNYEEAILAFSAAIEIDPKLADAYAKLAETHVAMGNMEQALEVLKNGAEQTGSETLTRQLEELTAEQEPEPEPKPEPEPTEEMTEVTSEDGSITIQATGNALSLSLVDPALQSSYSINRPETENNACECMWMVRFTDGVNTYEVGTSQWKFEGAEPMERSPYEMQSDVWLFHEGGASTIAGAELSIDGTTMTWSFSIPEEYDFQQDAMEILGTRKTLFGEHNTNLRNPS